MSTANQVQLDAANKTIRALFNQELSQRGEGEIVNALAMRTRSKAKTVEYNFLLAFDELREWIGERQIANLSVETFTIPNVKYESSLVVDRVDVESDSLGLYAPAIAERVQGYFRKRRSIFSDLLVNGATSGNNSYDGVSFFNASHPSDGNGASQSNFDTSTALTGANYDAAVQQMELLVDHRGNPMDILPDTLIVGSALRATVRDLFQISTINQDNRAGLNPYFGSVANIIVEPLITGSNWYLFDTSHGLNSLILQDADDFELQTLASIDDEFVIMNDGFFYGTRSRFGAGYGMWQLAYRADA